MSPSVLKTDGGKYVQIVKFKRLPKLCAVDAYKPDTKVETIQRQTNQNQFALKFYDQTEYYLKVDGNELKLVREQPNHSRDDFWFEKVNVNGSDTFGLRDAANEKYIMINTNTRQAILGVAQYKDQCCRFTEQN